MTLRLKWPGFQLTYDEGVLSLYWHEAAVLEVKAEHCVEASLRPTSGDDPDQLVLRFQSAAAEASDLIVMRVGVPVSHVQDAEHLIRRLRHDHGVPERHAADEERAELSRIPPAAGDWLLAPTGSASEELFDEVMARIENDAG